MMNVHGPLVSPTQAPVRQSFLRAWLGRFWNALWPTLDGEGDWSDVLESEEYALLNGRTRPYGFRTGTPWEGGM